MKSKDIKLFNLITESFIGCEALLFYYSPGFERPMVFLKRGSRYFIINFWHTAYIKTTIEWQFSGLTVEISEEEKSSSHHPYYRIYDRDRFEVFCQIFAVSEVPNGKETLDYSDISSELLRSPELLDRSLTTKTELKLLQKFPSLINQTAYLFQYHRWNRSLYLTINQNSAQTQYLVFNCCSFWEVDRIVSLNKIQTIYDSDKLILIAPEQHFQVQCISVELWNRDRFSSIDLDLTIKLGLDKRYGIRRSMFPMR
ncbi:MAG: hypothetical protein SWY16_15035 [Cyanobacteriota bacterium]|nr:hypothetical protein [Cyanobacteriota bacterium]